jgi:hypothetical protein
MRKIAVVEARGAAGSERMNRQGGAGKRKRPSKAGVSLERATTQKHCAFRIGEAG